MVEIKKEFYTLDSRGGELINYSGGTYIQDAITEIADSNTSVYYSDIQEFMCKNPEDVNEAVAEFGWDGCGGDLMRAAQMGEFVKTERDIYNELDRCLYNYALDYIIDCLGIDILPDEVFEEVENSIDEYAERFDDITAVIDEILRAAGIIDENDEITEKYMQEVLTK